MLRGIGVGCVCVSMLLCLYYIVIIARCFLYFFNSFTATLPFTICDTNVTATCCERSGDAANYFWWNNVLNASSSFNDVSNFNWELLGCLALSWIIVYACVFKGVESSGKVCKIFDNIIDSKSKL